MPKSDQFRLNLLGGPGSGKSTAAHYLMFKAKEHGGVAELAREVVKREAFKLNAIIQQRIVVDQVKEERAALATGCPLIICESPVMMQVAYAENARDRSFTLSMAKMLDNDFPNVRYVFLRRGDRKFIQAGRYHNEAESKALDEKILSLLEVHVPPERISLVDIGDWEGLCQLLPQES